MRYILCICIILSFLLTGCGEEEPAGKSTYKEPDWDKLVAGEKKKK